MLFFKNHKSFLCLREIRLLRTLERRVHDPGLRSISAYYGATPQVNYVEVANVRLECMSLILLPERHVVKETVRRALPYTSSLITRVY